MKKFILYQLAVIIGFGAIAQVNNPHDSFGKEYFQAVSKVVADINDNGFKGSDQKSLNYYRDISDMKLDISQEVAMAVYELQTQKGLNLEVFINEAKMSDKAKQFALQINASLSEYSPEEVRRYYEKLVEEIKESKFAGEEKELILKLAGLANYAYQNSDGLQEREDCFFGGEDGVALSPTACTIGAATMGGIVGFMFCGPWCAVGGAIVMGVLTAINVC